MKLKKKMNKINNEKLKSSLNNLVKAFYGKNK